MASINVDFSRLEAAAAKIEAHITYANNTMKTANLDAISLLMSWKGQDADDFNAAYSSLTSGGSAFSGYISSLQNYADFLKNAAQRYRAAMIDAYNEANSHPQV